MDMVGLSLVEVWGIVGRLCLPTMPQKLFIPRPRAGSQESQPQFFWGWECQA
jgi:hypothetical protein